MDAVELNKKLIISLIEDDLIHSKLIAGLNNVGLNADMYMLNLTNTVLSLMGLKTKEYVFEYYLELLKKSSFIDNSENNKGFKTLALEIYQDLLNNENSLSFKE